jgi:DNA-binding transcriptional ArsR family regulator
VIIIYRHFAMNTEKAKTNSGSERCCDGSDNQESQPMQSGSDLELAAICKALGHPVRIGIVRHLMRLDECVCGNIVDQFSLAQSTVSQHLKILKQAGVIKGTVEGTRVCYCLDHELLKRFRHLLSVLIMR